MPGEYKAAVVTSGDVRARISGDVVSISGVTVDVLVSGEVVLVSGQPVLVSGEVVLVSGQVVHVSGQVALVSGQPVLMSGETVNAIIFGGLSGATVQAGLDTEDLTSARVVMVGNIPWIYNPLDDEIQLAQTVHSKRLSATSVVPAVGLTAFDPESGFQLRLETIGSGEPILAIGHASGTRTISVSGQLIDSGGQTYTGVAVTFALGKYKRFAVFNTVTRSGASGQTVEVQVQFSEDAGTTWYDLVDGPFGALLYEGEQVGAVSTLRDVQTGKVAAGDLRIFIRTSGQTLDSNDNFTISSFVMLLN